jgi:hypothetical protein
LEDFWRSVVLEVAYAHRGRFVPFRFSSLAHVTGAESVDQFRFPGETSVVKNTKLSRLFTLFVLGLMVLLVEVSSAQAKKGGGKGQPSPSYAPGVIQLSDAPGDAVISDNGSPFSDGANGANIVVDEAAPRQVNAITTGSRGATVTLGTCTTPGGCESPWGESLTGFATDLYINASGDFSDGLGAMPDTGVVLGNRGTTFKFWINLTLYEIQWLPHPGSTIEGFDDDNDGAADRWRCSMSPNATVSVSAHDYDSRGRYVKGSSRELGTFTHMSLTWDAWQQ